MAKFIHARRQMTGRFSTPMNRYTLTFHVRGIQPVAIEHRYQRQEICSHPSKLTRVKENWTLWQNSTLGVIPEGRPPGIQREPRHAPWLFSHARFCLPKRRGRGNRSFGRVNVGSSPECQIILPPLLPKAIDYASSTTRVKIITYEAIQSMHIHEIWGNIVRKLQVRVSYIDWYDHLDMSDSLLRKNEYVVFFYA